MIDFPGAGAPSGETAPAPEEPETGQNDGSEFAISLEDFYDLLMEQQEQM